MNRLLIQMGTLQQTINTQYAPGINELESHLSGLQYLEDTLNKVVNSSALSVDDAAAIRESAAYKKQVAVLQAQQQKAIDETTKKLESLYTSATADQQLTSPEVQAIQKLAAQLEALQKTAEARVAKVYEIRIGNQSIQATSDPAEFLKALESARRSST